MRGVQDYFKRYRWGNADLQEFLDCLRRASGRDLTRWGQDWLQTTGLNTFHAHLAEQNGRYTSFAVEQTAIPAHPTLRAHRAGIGLYDRDAKGVLRLRRRVETDLTGALTPINELVGERVCDLVLLNDGDLTFAKLRFDDRSLETLKADLSKLADPLARALCWAAMWDLTRDGEMPAREFVELVARHAPAEKDSLLVERVTSQARSAIDLYGDPANRSAARERLHQVAVDPGQTAEGLAPELRLIWARILVATAASEESLARVAAMLDGTESIPGIDMDTDLRWLIVGQLSEEGNADVALIQATMASDPSDIGRRRGTACLAARPTAAAKEEAWQRVAERERADAQGVEGRNRRRALGRVDVGDPSRLLHRLGRGGRHDGARTRSGAAPPVRAALPRRAARRCGRSARSMRPRRSPSASIRTTWSMTRWSRRSTSRWRAASFPALRCGSCAKAATARCGLSAPAKWIEPPAR